MSNWPTDPHVCLCCGQRYSRLSVGPMTPDRMAECLMAFEGRGLTREELLGKHRAQLEYQAPGFVAWLETHSRVVPFSERWRDPNYDPRFDDPSYDEGEA